MVSGIVREIREVRDQADASHVIALAREFIEWLRSRYPEMSDELDAYLADQRFEEDLGDLLTVFNPPGGECLLAVLDGDPVGIVMCKRFDETTCEMNRMFVAERARGHGVGRALCRRLIVRARELGYETMMLTALDRHREALRLYESLGFVRDEGWQSDYGDREIAMTLDLALTGGTT